MLLATEVDNSTRVHPGMTLDDLAKRFGDMPVERIFLDPLPGTATEADAIRQNDTGRLCELVDGILIGKTMGLTESNLAYVIMRLLGNYLETNKIGTVFSTDGMMRLWPERIRVPDVSFVTWERLGDALERQQAALDGGPDLAIEIISPGNTRKELEAKLDEYFQAKVRAVWYVYPRRREVHVFRGPDDRTVLSEADTLDGGDVLPGFQLPLSELFATPGSRP